MIEARASGYTNRSTLVVRNLQHDCRVDMAALKAAFRDHLEVQLRIQRFEIAVLLVTPKRMARINKEHLNHEGPTDVITFDYGEHSSGELCGDMLICPVVAKTQAREYGVHWRSEIIRYFVHGILHLQGYDDREIADRRTMKREENRRLKALLSRHPVLKHKRSRKR